MPPACGADVAALLRMQVDALGAFLAADASLVATLAAAGAAGTLWALLCLSASTPPLHAAVAAVLLRFVPHDGGATVAAIFGDSDGRAPLRALSRAAAEAKAAIGIPAASRRQSAPKRALTMREKRLAERAEEAARREAEARANETEEEAAARRAAEAAAAAAAATAARALEMKREEEATDGALLPEGVASILSVAFRQRDVANVLRTAGGGGGGEAAAGDADADGSDGDGGGGGGGGAEEAEEWCELLPLLVYTIEAVRRRRRRGGAPKALPRRSRASAASLQPPSPSPTAAAARRRRRWGRVAEETGGLRGGGADGTRAAAAGRGRRRRRGRRRARRQARHARTGRRVWWRRLCTHSPPQAAADADDDVDADADGGLRR